MPIEDLKRRKARRSLPPARDRIIAAACRCFDNFGMAKTTVEDIANAAGVTRRTFYVNFSSKDHLVAELYAIEARHLAGQLAELAASTRPFDQRLTESLDCSMQVFAQKSYLRGLMFQRLTAVSRNPDDPIHHAQVERWQALITPAIADGTIAADLQVNDVVDWLSLSGHILLSRFLTLEETEAERHAFIRNFVVEPLLANRGHGVPLPRPDPDPGLPDLRFRAPRPSSERILAAAADCFAEAGIHKTTISTIAARASVARRTVYRYFVDKQDLIEELVFWQAARIRGEIRGAVDRKQPFADYLTDCVLIGTQLAYGKAFVRELSENPCFGEGPASFEARIHAQICGYWQPVLETAMARGEIQSYLSIREIASWLYFFQSLILAKIDIERIAEAELRAFIRRFMVTPITAT